MRPRIVSISAVVALGCAAGCSLITGYDGFTGGESAPPDSGTRPDAALDSGPPQGDAGMTTEETLCAPDIPLPPSVPKTQSFTSYAGVVSQLRFMPADGGCATLGKNLDGIYTCDHDAGPACQLGYGSAKNCDQAGGVDNNAQMGFESFLGPSTLASLPADLLAQRTGFVLTLNGYGGDLNDPSVNVGFQIDVGTADGGTLVDETSLVASHVLVQASEAYVTNGVLVAKFDTQQVPLHFTQTVVDDSGPFGGIHGVTIPISYARLIGHPIVGDAGLTMNDAQLVGRIEIVDLTTALSSLIQCTNASVAPALVCPSLDLPANPADDGTGLYCEAISVGAGFDMVPTVVVGTGPVLPPIDHCGSDSPPVRDDVCAPASAVDAGADADADAGADSGSFGGPMAGFRSSDAGDHAHVFP